MTTRFVLDLNSISDGQRWHDASGRAIVLVMGEKPEIRAGQAVEAAGQIATIAPPLNPGEFDYRAFLQAQGIRLRLTIDEPESFWRDSQGTDRTFALWLDNHRYRIRQLLFGRLEPSIAPLAGALLLGRREEIDPEVNDAFARTGTTHLLAISGLQLQALALCSLLVFRVLGMPRRPAYLMVGLTMLGYAFLVGPAPSVVRSTVMTATFCLAAIARRQVPPGQHAVARRLGDSGYQSGIPVRHRLPALLPGDRRLVWLVPPSCTLLRHIFETIRGRLFGPRSALDDLERRLEPWWRRALRRAGASMVDGVVASTVVWLAALPLVAFRFHLVSPIGILLNIPLIPLTTAALLLGGLSLLLSAAWGPLGSPWPGPRPSC